jgi:hypothetical protein
MSSWVIRLEMALVGVLLVLLTLLATVPLGKHA